MNIKITKIQIFFMLAGFLFFITSIYIGRKYSSYLDREYSEVTTNVVVSGVVINIKREKGDSFIAMRDGRKINITTSRNYSYDKISLYEFLQVGDSLNKKENSDTLRIFRRDKEYFFIIGNLVLNKK